MAKQSIGLYLNAEPSCGGTYTYNRLILSAALESGFNVSVVTESNHWAELLKEYNISYVQVKTPTLWRVLPRLWHKLKLPVGLFRGLAKRFHPLAKAMISLNQDIWIFPSQDALTYLMPVPAMGVVHDLMHRYEAQFPEVGAKHIVKGRDYLYGNMGTYAKGIFVDSQVGQQQLYECYGFPSERTYILPYTVVVQSVQHDKSELISKYQLPEKYLFYPAQFWAHKNHLRLLQALANLKQVYPEIAIVLAGSPKNGYDAVKKQVKALNLEANVKFVGFVPEQDIASFFKYARALIMPTFFGPTNIPPLEAHVYDCPVGISGIYGMQAQLEDAALYFDPKSVQSIQEAMQQLWTDDALCYDLIEKGDKLAKKWNPETFKQRFREHMNRYFGNEENSDTEQDVVNL